jgi:hypothetical protein
MGTWLASLDKVTFDQTLAAARQAIGPDRNLNNPAHAARVRVWLNDWGCRLRYPRTGDPSDPFTTNLGAWWQEFADRFGFGARPLAQLSNAEIRALAEAYDALRRLAASPPNAQRRRCIGLTAAAKILFFQYPETVTAWDRRIAQRFGGGHGCTGFAAQLTRCRGWAEEIISSAAAAGIAANKIGPAVSRPNSTVAKLIEEYLYQVVSRGKRF